MARKCVNVAYTHTTFGNDTEHILNSHKFILPYFLALHNGLFPNTIMQSWNMKYAMAHNHIVKQKVRSFQTPSHAFGFL